MSRRAALRQPGLFYRDVVRFCLHMVSCLLAEIVQLGLVCAPLLACGVVRGGTQAAAPPLTGGFLSVVCSNLCAEVSGKAGRYACCVYDHQFFLCLGSGCQQRTTHCWRCQMNRLC